MSSWERKRPPKPPNGVQILALLLADVAEQRGSGSVNRIMLVQIQSSALVCLSRWCSGSHGVFLKPWSRFDSWSGR